jgi:mannitol/fructose-specific phosphotransferase system IIA component (Ntr-type)
MNLEDLIKADSVLCNVSARSKKHCLEILSELLTRSNPDIASEEVFAKLIERERLGCTCLDKGVAFPHCRIAGLRKSTGALMKLAEPIDFDSADGQSVDIVFGLMVPEDLDAEDLSDIDAYYSANMALLETEPPLDLYQEDWKILTYQGQYPPARTVPGLSGTEGIFVNSMLSAGTVISGGGVNHSILFPRVRVADGAIVEDAILFNDVSVGEGAHLRRCIVDKDVVVPPGARIGFDKEADAACFTVSESGVVVIPKGFRF